MPRVYFGRYKSEREIGQGSFGIIYSGVDLFTKERVAIKIEKNDVRVSTLEREALLYKKFSGLDCVPKFYHFGEENNELILVIQLLGESLCSLFKKYNGDFSVKTVLMLGIQMIECVRQIHSRNYLHRDIKPENFMIGVDDEDWKVYIIDFGLSKKYIENGHHIPMVTNKSFTGTARYASINTLEGCTNSRRDDLEAVCYCLLLFFRGSLPWSGYRAERRSVKHRYIANEKRKYGIESICHGFPEGYKEMFRAIRDLSFKETPNYSFYTYLLSKALERLGFENDADFEWCYGSGANASFSWLSGMDLMDSTPPYHTKRKKSPVYNQRSTKKSHKRRYHIQRSFSSSSESYASPLFRRGRGGDRSFRGIDTDFTSDFERESDLTSVELFLKRRGVL